MESGFCPECTKIGIKRRMKIFQINLKEAVWSCEAEDCSWPIDYEDLTFIDRDSATVSNWDEFVQPSLVKENTPTLMELSLYTPPVTPGGELAKELTETASMEYSLNPPMEDKLGRTLPKQEFIGSNKPPLFESLELRSINSTEEQRNIVKEQIASISISRTLPKVINIEKTNINLTVVSNVNEHHCNNTKIGTGYSFTNPTVTTEDTFKNLNISDDICTEFALSTQNKTGSKQNESGMLHSDATVSGVETNFGAETLLETTKTLVNVNTTNSSNKPDGSIANISGGDVIDTLLQGVLNDEVILDIDEEWLNLLMS